MGKLQTQPVPAVSQSQSLQAQIDALKAENEKLRAARVFGNRLTYKVTPKGGVSIYGLQRFPVTLFKDQWIRLAKAMPELEAFMKENDSKLSTKDVAHKTAEVPTQQAAAGF